MIPLHNRCGDHETTFCKGLTAQGRQCRTGIALWRRRKAGVRYCSFHADQEGGQGQAVERTRGDQRRAIRPKPAIPAEKTSNQHKQPSLRIPNDGRTRQTIITGGGIMEVPSGWSPAERIPTFRPAIVVARVVPRGKRSYNWGVSR